MSESMKLAWDQGLNGWWKIKSPWALLVVRPLAESMWDYRVQLYGPLQSHAIGEGRLFNSAEGAKDACLVEAKAVLASELKALSVRKWESDSGFVYGGSRASFYESTSRVSRELVFRSTPRTWCSQVHFFGPEPIDPLGLSAGFVSAEDAMKSARESLRAFLLDQIDALPGDRSGVLIPEDATVRVVVSEKAE